VELRESSEAGCLVLERNWKWDCELFEENKVIEKNKVQGRPLDGSEDGLVVQLWFNS